MHLAAELDTSSVSINDHVPWNAKRRRERWIYSGAAALLKINNGYSMRIHRPVERSAERMNKKIFRNAFNQNPTPSKKDFATNAASMKSKFLFVLTRRQHSTSMP